MVGAGPAGLACAHRLALLGHETTVFEARQKLGGLNEYGIAAYKVPHDFAQAEVDFILGLGGIEVRTGKALGRDITLSALRRDFDAVFLGMGLAGVNALAAEGEDLAGRRGCGRLYRAAAPDLGQVDAADRPAGGGDRRRQHRHRHRRAEPSASAPRTSPSSIAAAPSHMSATDHEQDPSPRSTA